MADNSQFAHEDIARLREEYATPYHAIIREHIVMGVTRYFLERWVPILGVAPATVVNTLRQLNFHTPDQAITISGSALAREASMSRRHLYTCLEKDWISAFIQIEPGKRARGKSGKVLQEANTYYIRMSDPLAPADAHSLMLHLRKMGTTPLEAAKSAMNSQPRDLWAVSHDSPSDNFQDPAPITAREVLEKAFPGWQPASQDEKEAFEQAATALHSHIVLENPDGRISKIIVPQYFRTRWWKHLGHDLAWSYLWLRGFIYDNPTEGVARYNCWIPSLDILLSLINRPREWWRRNVERPTAKNGAGGSIDFFQQLESQKGRDPVFPQRVARRFMVRIEIPIAPSDRALYSQLLIDWPDHAVFASTTTASTSPQTPPKEVHHIQTHRPTRGLPHSDTPANQGSATFEHTETGGVCHIQTQGSATFVHRDSSTIKALLNTSTSEQTQHSTTIRNPEPIAAGAENTNNHDESKTLLSQLAEALNKTPDLPLYRALPIATWFQKAWAKPVSPHTPAWLAIRDKKILERDVFALMLAISADPSIEHRPRYLSWLIQKWQGAIDSPPVVNWSRWQELADISLRDWNTKGRSEWIELAAVEKRELPFGMEELFDQSAQDQFVANLVSEDNQNQDAAPTKRPKPGDSQKDQGLAVRVGNGEISIRDVWRAALSQLSIKLHKSIYNNWVEGTQPVSFEDGILTLRARHFMAREQLSRRYNSVIEETVSDLAKEKITIRYVID